MQIRNKGYAVEPIHAAKPHPSNVRRGDLEAIEESIGVNGFWGAIVVQDSTDLIIIGNHRWRAMVKLGAEEIPIIRVVCTDAQARKFALADNRTSDLAGYDERALAEELQRLANEEGLAGSGYDADDVQGVLADLDRLARSAGDEASQPPSTTTTPGPATTTSQDEADDLASLNVPDEPTTKKGDIWRLGEHLLICGDSFQEAVRSRVIKKPADLIVMDPPYAIFGSSTGIGADIADDLMVQPFFENLFRFARVSVRKFAHIYVCCDWRTHATIVNAAKALVLSHKNTLIWDKGGGGLGSNYANTYEMVVYLARLPKATGLKSTTERGQRVVYSPNLVRYPRVQGEEREHNAQKPTSMIELFIENSSDVGETVIDFFAGSGTTLIACERKKRKCITFEIHRAQCDKIVARWERVTGQRGMRIPAEETAPESAPEPEDKSDLVS